MFPRVTFLISIASLRTYAFLCKCFCCLLEKKHLQNQNKADICRYDKGRGTMPRPLSMGFAVVLCIVSPETLIA